MAWVLVANIDFVALHGPDGRLFYINPVEIATLRVPIPQDLRHLAGGTNCIVGMTNGKFWSTNETCDQVYSILHSRIYPGAPQ